MTVYALKKERKKEMTVYALKKERKKKKDILTSFKRPKWPIRPNKRLHLKCCLVFENNNKKKEVNNTP